MRAYLIYAVLCVAALVLGVAWLYMLTPFMPALPTFSLPGADAPRTLVLDGHTISVSVADTDEERVQGLSGRSGLAPDEGMLFVFNTDGKYAFWMKDMRFPIDILWLSADGRIRYIAPNVSPDTYPQTFVSTALARYVLELPAGYAEENGVSVGDTVQL